MFISKSNLFVLFWFLLNLLQITFTDLTSDEGYYWFYTTHLQWGYYDHPPLIALLVKLGTEIFPAETGVRFFNLVCLTAAVKLFLSLLPAVQRNSFTTFLLLISAPLLNYFSFIIFPDGPLLFAMMLFLVCYRKFLQNPSFKTSVFIGCSIALMMYSKYHGLLVVAFTVIANPKLIRSKWFWIAAAISFTLFLPHLWWQYQNDFPTLRYHLQGRTETFSFRFLPEFFSQQIVAISPALIMTMFFARAKDVFERTLLFIIFGTFIFFTFTAFKAFVHFHWTSIAVFPLLYFAAYFYHHEKRKKLMRYLVLPFVVIIIAARFVMLVDVGIKRVGEDYYHGRENWAAQIKSIAAGRPVFFPNNLREASLYQFYSGEMGVALYETAHKKSQYELWNYEDSLQHKNVLMLTKYPPSGSRQLKTAIGEILFISDLHDFRSYYNGVSIDISTAKRTEDAVTIIGIVKNQRNTNLNFDGAVPVQLIYFVKRSDELVTTDVVKTLTAADNLLPQQEKTFQVLVPLKELEKGNYQIVFGFRHSVLPDSYNSNAINIKVY